MKSLSSMPRSIWLAPSSAPGPSQNITTTDPDPLELSQVKLITRIESDYTALRTRSSVLLQVPTMRETFDRLYEARAPPPLTVSSDRLVGPSGSSREESQSDNLYKNSSISPPNILLPPSPPSESEHDSDSDAPVMILRPPSPSQTKTRPKFEAPEPKVQNKLTRRYLSPTYIRGESLPFAIKEVNEPETSESQYSVESALDLSDAPADPDSSVTSGSTSQPLHSEEEDPSGGSTAERSAPKSSQISGSAKSEDEGGAHRSSTGLKKGRILLRQISPKKSIKNMLAMGKRLGIRGRLRSLRE